MKTKRQLKNMDIEEVSLVDRPANKRKFLLIKREDGEITELTIKTDGTVDGSSLSVNGEEVKDLKAFWFALWPSDDFDEGMMSGSYTVSETDGTEFDRETTFNLTKGMNTMKLETILKSLNIEPASVSADRTQDLETLLKFVDMMPPDDGASALNVIKASLVKEEVPAEAEEPPAEVPAEVEEASPEDIAAIRASMSQLNAMLPEAERSVLKAEKPDALTQIMDAIAKLAKDAEPVIKQDEKAPDNPPVTLADIANRLIKVEKTTGVSEDEETDDEDLDPEVPLTSEENLKKYGTKYPRAQSSWGAELLKQS